MEQTQETLIQELKNNLYDTSFNNEKSKKLAQCGFISDENTIKFLEEEKFADRLFYYRQTYPMYKIINWTLLVQVLNKFGLMLMRVRDYKNNVPDKNLNEISNLN